MAPAEPAAGGAAEDAAFRDRVAVRLAALPGVVAVALGGSRAAGTHRPDSDWDFAVYYRGGGPFSVDAVRALGWEGEVFEIGGWGGGVFNGGAWFTVEGRRLDLHYRDLTDVEQRLAEAERGEFDVQPLLFHLAGIPTTIVVAELAGNQVLSGTLPRPGRYPDALRRSAWHRWWQTAQLELDHARAGHAAAGHRLETAGALARAGMMAAHAVLAGRGVWVTNEKRLLDRAGLRELDGLVGRVSGAADGDAAAALDAARATMRDAVLAARPQGA